MTQVIIQAVALLLALSLVAAQDSSAPRLKPGRVPFISRLFRPRSAGNPQVAISLSQGSNVILDLEPDHTLLSPDYEEVHISETGERTVLRRAADIHVCWFKGRVLGDPESEVTVTDCNGVFNGIIRQGNGPVYVAKWMGDGDVAVYPTDDEEADTGSCGSAQAPRPGRTLLEHVPLSFAGVLPPQHHHTHRHHHHHHHPNPPQPPQVHHQQQQHHHHHPKITLDRSHRDHVANHHHQNSVHRHESQPHTRGLLDYSGTQEVMEVALVSDALYMARNARNETAVGQRNILLMSLANAIYQKAAFDVPVVLSLKAQYFFTTGDPYTMSKNSAGNVVALTLLETFKAWASNTLSSLPYDAVHLLTAYTFTDTTKGIAYIAEACNNDYKYGLSTAWTSNAITANTLAHELGHNLGMNHDGDSSVNTQGCPGSGYLMGLYTNSCPTSGVCPVSSCSLKSKNAFTSSPDCLNTWTNPTCTDGLWNGEETGYDCGGPSCPPCVSPTSYPTTPRPTTRAPTRKPTRSPTPRPTARPTSARPTRLPTTHKPTAPTRSPVTKGPTRTPTKKPTTLAPTKKPTTPAPSKTPTSAPTGLI